MSPDSPSPFGLPLLRDLPQAAPDLPADFFQRPERRDVESPADLAQQVQPGPQLGVLSRPSPGPLISADPHAATIVRVGAAHTGNNHG